MVGAFWDLFRQRSSEQNMREALAKWCAADNKTFNPFVSDKTFTAVDEMVGVGVDFVVSGHTHLQRALRRQNGPGFYYNCGSWIDLIEITEEMIKDDTLYHALWQALDDGSIESLKDPGHGLRLIKNIRTVVSIIWEDESAVGRLETVEEDGPEGFYLKPVAQSEFRR